MGPLSAHRHPFRYSPKLHPRYEFTSSSCSQPIVTQVNHVIGTACYAPPSVGGKRCQATGFTGSMERARSSVPNGWKRPTMPRPKSTRAIVTSQSLARCGSATGWSRGSSPSPARTGARKPASALVDRTFRDPRFGGGTRRLTAIAAHLRKDFWCLPGALANYLRGA